MTHVELQAIKQRIDIAKNCHGETFDADINGEDPRQNVDILRDQDRSALYLEVLALSVKLIEVEQQRDFLGESREGDLKMIQELDADRSVLSVKLEEAEKQRTKYYDLGHSRTCSLQIARAKLEEAHAQRDALRADIRTLESLYSRDGMAQMLASQIEKIFDRVLRGDTDVVSAASPGEIVKACPQCGAHLIAQGPSGRWVCGRCDVRFDEPAYYQKVNGSHP